MSTAEKSKRGLPCLPVQVGYFGSGSLLDQRAVGLGCDCPSEALSRLVFLEWDSSLRRGIHRRETPGRR